MVTWAPKRVELYTLADPFDPEPIPWVNSLAVHESRHVSQMQLGYKGLFKYTYWITGEVIPAALSAVYANTYFLEGDAVVAETALSSAGRGRSAQFLSYYMAAFDGGDMRNFYRWRWGSYRYHAPNHYAIGYLTIGGTRYFYDDPLFTQRYFDIISKRPWRLFNFPKEVKRASGMSFGKTFAAIADSLNRQWSEERALRGEQTVFAPISPLPSWYTVHNAPTSLSGKLYFLENSKISPTQLVMFDSTGTRKVLRPFSSSASGLESHGSRLYWNESIPDRRWGMAQSSRIRYIDMEGGKNQIVDLTKDGRYYSPAPSGDGKSIAAISSPYEGGTLVVLLDSEKGKETSSLRSPDSLQVYKPVWVGKDLYVGGVSESGEGIYRVDFEDGTIVPVLPPVRASLHSLREHGGRIIFSSDRTAVQEIYSFDPKDGIVRQLTVSPYGTRDPRFVGDTLYSVQTLREGDLLVKSLPGEGREVDYSVTTPYKMAEALSSQEKALAQGNSQAHLWPEDNKSETTFSAPRPYSKLGHLFRIHSWAPLYINVNDISKASFESVFNTTALGATVMYQNTLGTSYGTMGYFYAKDTSTGKMRHGGHFDMTYTGLYPIIKADLTVGERDIRQYRRVKTSSGDISFTQVTGNILECPLVNFSLESYIPFNFSSGGWSRGFIPRVAFSITNDRYSKSIAKLDGTGTVAGDARNMFVGVDEGDNVTMKNLSVTARGYIMQGKASSMTYPRLGISAEVGARARVGLASIYTPAAYLYMYGYLPGITRTQGLRLSASMQHQFKSPGVLGENAIYVSPRGFSSGNVDTYLSSRSTDQLKLGFDYSIPVYVGDISFMSPFLYIKNFELRPHGDIMIHSVGDNTSGKKGWGNLFSVGADILAKSANLIWIPYDTTMGIRLGYNGGSSFEDMAGAYLVTKHFYVEAVFSVDL